MSVVEFLFNNSSCLIYQLQLLWQLTPPEMKVQEITFKPELQSRKQTGMLKLY